MLVSHTESSPQSRSRQSPAKRALGGILLAVLAALAGCSRAPETRYEPGVGRLRLLEAAGETRPAVAAQLDAAIGRGGSLSHALTQVAGMPAAAADPWIHALATVLDLRRLRPDDRLRVELDAPGNVARIEIMRNRAERYEAVRTASGSLMARRIPVLTENRVRRVSGAVETSLFDAMLESGGDAELVARTADLLAYDVDFFTDPRPGDHFDVLVEETWAEGERIESGAILLARYEGERASQTAYRFMLPGGRADYYDATGSSVRKALLRSPLNYRRVTSHFSHRRRHPISRTYHAHLGVDFAAPLGTPVVAVGDATVTFAGYKGANGNLVILRHANGYETYYLHLSRFAAGVRRGQRVAQGQVIGAVGATGAATGPHLDFRVKHRGRFLDPLKLTLPPGPPVPAGSRPAFTAEQERLLALIGQIAPGEVMPVQKPVNYASDAATAGAPSTL